MFRCEECGRQSIPREDQYTVVTEYYQTEPLIGQIKHEMKVCESCVKIIATQSI
mgnify:FL=1